MAYSESGHSLYSASDSYSEHNYMCYVDQEEDEEYDKSYEYYVIKNENGKCTKYVFNYHNQFHEEMIGAYNSKGNFVASQTTTNDYGTSKKIFDKYYAT